MTPLVPTPHSPQSLYSSVDDVRANKADKEEVEVEVREVSPIHSTIHYS